MDDNGGDDDGNSSMDDLVDDRRSDSGSIHDPNHPYLEDAEAGVWGIWPDDHEAADLPLIDGADGSASEHDDGDPGGCRDEDADGDEDEGANTFGDEDVNGNGDEDGNGDGDDASDDQTLANFVHDFEPFAADEYPSASPPSPTSVQINNAIPSPSELHSLRLFQTLFVTNSTVRAYNMSRDMWRNEGYEGLSLNHRLISSLCL